MTIEFLAQILLRKKLLSREQFGDIIKKGAAQQAKLQKYAKTSYSQKLRQAPYSVSATDVILSFNVEIPGTGGKILTEDAITLAIAEDIGEETKNLKLPTKNHTVYYGEGCLECRRTGYRGRHI
ncbi:MAG: hypothetical protein EPN22_14910 [Nitrospirae bacterium]|nr:MAG: hypothetical protein EPN22_14910 [Nitrospirota bacterium]